MPMQTTDQWGSLLPKGLGTDQEATQATSAMRQSPWYQDWAKKNNLQFQGDSYGNARLNDSQQQDLYNLALKNGIGLNDKYDQIDENGQISEAHHKLRNALIAAAIGGASLTGLGAAGIGPLSGMFGAGAGAAGAGVGIGETAATGIGGLTATSLGLPVTAGLGTAGAAAGAAAPLIGSIPSEFGWNAVDTIWSPAAAAGAGGAAGGAAGATLGGGSGSTMTTPSLVSGMASNTQGIPAAFGANAVDTVNSAAPLLQGAGMTSNAIGQLVPATAGKNLSGASGGSSIIDKILKMASSNGKDDPMATISSLLGSASSGAKANRVVEGNFAGQFDRNSIAAQDSAGRARDSAMHDLAVANYLKSAKGYTSPTISLNGQDHTLPDFGFAPKAPSDEQRRGAGMLSDTALKTLGPNGTYTPMPFSNYGTPGAGENALSTGATISGFLDPALNFWKMFRGK